MIGPLPAELKYLQDLATRVGPAWRHWAGEGRVERNGPLWRELAQLHERLCRQEDGLLIRQWLAQPSTPGRLDDRRREVMGLMRLLRSLGKAGVPPFHQPVLVLTTVRRRKQPSTESAADKRPLDRSLLEHLREAQSLGITPRWDSLAHFVDAIDQRRFDALCLLVDRMQRLGDHRRLRQMLAQRRIARRSDHAMAKSLLHVIDALEIF